LVSAALRVGTNPHQALLKALRFCEICARMETMAELEVVLNRSKFDRYLNRKNRQTFVANLHRSLRLFVVQSSSAMENLPRCRDPKDDQYLALALAAEADAIVSSDHDLLVLNPWCGIRILSPAEFLAEGSHHRP
jgi:putative PIN family toxin of toxin-antitoxin system